MLATYKKTTNPDALDVIGVFAEQYDADYAAWRASENGGGDGITFGVAALIDADAFAVAKGFISCADDAWGEWCVANDVANRGRNCEWLVVGDLWCPLGPIL